MKGEYTGVEINVIKFESEDVIVTSCVIQNNDWPTPCDEDEDN